MDAKNYRLTDGDRLDLVVLKHYGDHSMLGEVIKANPFLCDSSLALESGRSIILPLGVEIKIEVTHKTLQEKSLW